MASRSPTTRDKAQVSNAAFGFAANHDVVTLPCHETIAMAAGYPGGSRTSWPHMTRRPDEAWTARRYGQRIPAYVLRRAMGSKWPPMTRTPER